MTSMHLPATLILRLSAIVHRSLSLQVKAGRIQTLATGLVYFISEAFRSGEEGDLVKWASEIAKETLRDGVDVI